MKRCFLNFSETISNNTCPRVFFCPNVTFSVSKTQETNVRVIVIIVVPHYSTSISRKCRTIDSCSSNDFDERKKIVANQSQNNTCSFAFFGFSFTQSRALTLVVAPFLSLVRSLPLVFSLAQKKRLFWCFSFTYSHTVSRRVGCKSHTRSTTYWSLSIFYFLLLFWFFFFFFF